MRIGGKPWEKGFSDMSVSEAELFKRLKKVDHFIANCHYLGDLFAKIFTNKTGNSPSLSVFDIGV